VPQSTRGGGIVKTVSQGHKAKIHYEAESVTSWIWKWWFWAL